MWLCSQTNYVSVLCMRPTTNTQYTYMTNRKYSHVVLTDHVSISHDPSIMCSDIETWQLIIGPRQPTNRPRRNQHTFGFHPPFSPSSNAHDTTEHAVASFVLPSQSQKMSNYQRAPQEPYPPPGTFTSQTPLAYLPSSNFNYLNFHVLMPSHNLLISFMQGTDLLILHHKVTP